MLASCVLNRCQPSLVDIVVGKCGGSRSILAGFDLGLAVMIDPINLLSIFLVVWSQYSRVTEEFNVLVT